MLFRNGILSYPESQFTHLPTARNGFTRRSRQRQGGLQSVTHPVLRAFCITMQKSQPGHSLFDRHSSQPLKRAKLFEGPKCSFRPLIIAELEKRITEDLKRVPFARFELDQAFSVITRGYKIVRSELGLRQQRQCAGVVVCRQRREGVLRRLRGNLQRRQIARFAKVLKMPRSEFVLGDEIVCILPDFVL